MLRKGGRNFKVDPNYRPAAFCRTQVNVANKTDPRGCFVLNHVRPHRAAFRHPLVCARQQGGSKPAAATATGQPGAATRQDAARLQHHRRHRGAHQRPALRPILWPNRPGKGEAANVTVFRQSSFPHAPWPSDCRCPRAASGQSRSSSHCASRTRPRSAPRPPGSRRAVQSTPRRPGTRWWTTCTTGRWPRWPDSTCTSLSYWTATPRCGLHTSSETCVSPRLSDSARLGRAATFAAAWRRSTARGPARGSRAAARHQATASMRPSRPTCLRWTATRFVAALASMVIGAQLYDGGYLSGPFAAWTTCRFRRSRSHSRCEAGAQR